MMFDLVTGLDWEQLIAFFGVAGLFCSALIWLGRMVMSRNFVTRADHLRAAQRITSLEERVQLTATKQDLKAVEERLVPMKTDIAVMSEKMDGIKTSVEASNHLLRMLNEHLLERGAAG